MVLRLAVWARRGAVILDTALLAVGKKTEHALGEQGSSVNMLIVVWGSCGNSDTWHGS